MDAKGSMQPWHVFNVRYALCACRTAAAGWRYRGSGHFVENRNTMLIEAGEFHRNTVVHKRSDFKLLLLEPQTFEDITRDMPRVGVPHFRHAQANDPRVFEAIYDYSNATESGATNLEIESRLTACIHLLLEYTERGCPVVPRQDEHDRVGRAKRLLRDRFAEAVSLSDLARETGLSRFHLIRAFSKEVGFPPHAYQIHVRVERARSLLKLGVPPADVAEMVGFADQSHLTRHFKRIMRVTPSTYVHAKA
jgi:AraC-like DNA-binding protein